MDHQATCLTDNDLLQLVSGNLPSTDLENWAAHLESCPSCLRKIQQLKPTDLLSTSLPQATDLADGPDAETVTRLIIQLKSMPSAVLTQHRLSHHSHETAQLESWDFLAKPEASDEIGRLGPYRILKVLGRGGMGVVFQAEDPALQRLIALKVMLPTLAIHPSAKQRFLREARAAAALKHDNIVSIYQVGEDRGIPYSAMEFLQGESLDDRLKRSPMMPVTEIIKIGLQVAEGLEAAHELKLIHRDIKPGNIWLETKGKSGFRVKILDFGLARLASDQTHLTQSGVIVGTPAYMAPEQASDQELDPRSDLFSLGVVLYLMCTGEMPFKGKNTISILSSLANTTPLAPNLIRKDLPDELSDLIVDLLAKDPEKRSKNAHDVVVRLRMLEHLEKTRAFTQVQLVHTILTPIKSEPAKQKPPRRSRFAFVALALMFFGFFSLGVVFFLQTADGTIRVEILDPKIKASLDQEGIQLDIVDSKPIRVKPGKQGMQIERDGFVFETTNFELKQGESTSVKVEWIDKGKVKVSRDGKDFFPSIKKMPIADASKHLFEILTSPDYEWSAPENLGPGINSDANEMLYGMTEDELTILVARHFSLMISQRKSIEEQFPAPEPMHQAIRNGSITGDGLELVLGKREGDTNEELLICKRPNVSIPFPNPELVPEPVNNLGGERRPVLSPDGLTLMVTKAGEIYVYHRESREHPFGNRTQLPEPVNTPVWDLPIWISNDGRLLCTNSQSQPKNIHKTWFWMKASQEDPYIPFDLAPWLSNVCSGVYISADGRRMYYDAETAEGLGKKDIWMVRRIEKKRRDIKSSPIDPAWFTRVAALPAKEQIREVTAKLKERNSYFDGKVESDIEEGVVVGFSLRTDEVTDVSPIAALKALRYLKCGNEFPAQGRLKDISPMRGLPLRELILFGNTELEDISPLRSMPLEVLNLYICEKLKNIDVLEGMQLRELNLGVTAIADLRPLSRMPLRSLNLWGCKNVTDLSPLEKLSLTDLNVEATSAFDLTPLRNMPLQIFNYQPETQRFDAILRRMQTLQLINDKPVEQFWKERGKAD